MVRDKSHNDFIERWAGYMREHPDSWKKYHTAFIDAQFEKAYDVIAKILQEKDGEEKLARMYKIKNLKGHPKLFKRMLQQTKV